MKNLFPTEIFGPPEHCQSIEYEVKKYACYKDKGLKNCPKHTSSKTNLLHSFTWNMNTVNMKPLTTLATLNPVCSNYFWHPTFTVKCSHFIFISALRVFNTRNSSIFLCFRHSSRCFFMFLLLLYRYLPGLMPFTNAVTNARAKGQSHSFAE